MRVMLLAASLLLASTAHAEYINGHNTWIAKDRTRGGILHYEAGSDGRWGWTTSGTVFSCKLMSKNEANHLAVIDCPQVGYTITLSRHQMTLNTPGVPVNYAGNWDDRRFWYYTYSDTTQARFELRDNFKWIEKRWVNGVLQPTIQYREYDARDDEFVYLVDEQWGGVIEVALGKSAMYVRSIGAGTWGSPAYRGHW